MMKAALVMILIVLTSGCLHAPSEKDLWCQDLEEELAKEAISCTCEAAHVVSQSADNWAKDIITPECNCECIKEDGSTIKVQIAKPKPRTQ